MFTHSFVGCLVMLIWGLSNHKVNVYLLLYNALVASLPDLLYVIEIIKNKAVSGKFKINKNSHKHRDGICHSIFFPFFIIGLVYLFAAELVVPSFIASISHPLLDMWGIGWGVKLFYPFSNKTYKLFYKDKILTVFTPTELEKEIANHGDDEWLYKVLITYDADGVPCWYGKIEWFALAGFISMVVSVVVIY